MNMPPLATRFTPENSRLMAARSWEARRAAKAAETERTRLIKAAWEAAARGEEPQAAAGDYASRRLARVRSQLDALDNLLADEMAAARPDPARLDRYASAQSRLATQEQQLAGRPLPGSRRPGRERSRPSPFGGGCGPAEPID